MDSSLDLAAPFTMAVSVTHCDVCVSKNENDSVHVTHSLLFHNEHATHCPVSAM